MAAINQLSLASSNHLELESCEPSGEDTPLQLPKKARFSLAISTRRYRTTRKCVSSKSALLILLWCFVLGLWNGVVLNPDLYLRNFIVSYALAGYFLVAFIFCFFPLAGFLADVKYGRYRTAKFSLCLLLIPIPLIFVCSGLVGIFYVLAVNHYAVLYVCMALVAVVGLFVLGVSYIGLIGFSANVVQFGMDQLHDSPGEDRTLFIHWYVWGYYTTACIGQLAWNLAIQYPYNFNRTVSSYNFAGFFPARVDTSDCHCSSSCYPETC